MTLTLDLLTPEVHRFTPLLRGSLVPICIKIGSFFFKISVTVTVTRTFLMRRLLGLVTNERTGKKHYNNNNNNNNNNNHDNVYGAVIMAEPLREFTRFI